MSCKCLRRKRSLDDDDDIIKIRPIISGPTLPRHIDQDGRETFLQESTTVEKLGRGAEVIRNRDQVVSQALTGPEFFKQKQVPPKPTRKIQSDLLSENKESTPYVKETPGIDTKEEKYKIQELNTQKKAPPKPKRKNPPKRRSEMEESTVNAEKTGVVDMGDDTRTSSSLNIPPDQFCESEKVYGLKFDSFKELIPYQDAAFVFFYDPSTWKCKMFKKLYVRAASNDSNSVYAAVNCGKESPLCIAEDVKSMPFIKFFSRGALINTYGVADQVDVELPKHSASLPHLEQAPRPKRPCD